MSFVNKIKSSKEKYKDIENCNSAKAYLSNHIYELGDFCLELNGSFKMVSIKYNGIIETIMKSNYRGVFIKHSRGQVIIINTRNSLLNENILFQYIGVINKISQVTVYRWGKRSMNATIVQVNRGDISNDDNIISSDSMTIRDPSLGHNEKHSIEMQRKIFEDREKIGRMLPKQKKLKKI